MLARLTIDWISDLILNSRSPQIWSQDEVCICGWLLWTDFSVEATHKHIPSHHHTERSHRYVHMLQSQLLVPGIEPGTSHAKLKHATTVTEDICSNLSGHSHTPYHTNSVFTELVIIGILPRKLSPKFDQVASSSSWYMLLKQGWWPWKLGQGQQIWMVVTYITLGQK